MIRLLLLSLTLHMIPAFGYVTSGLPGHKHRAWLKQLTEEFTNTTPGQLSQEMCTQAPRLLSAWAQNPYVPHTSKSESVVFPHHGRECAETCERILKRLVDERRAGNTNAVIADTEAYNLIMDIWSKSGERGAAAQRAEEILISMQMAYCQEGIQEVRPDLNSFKFVLTAWSRAKGEEYAPHRAQRLLDWMISLYDSGTNESIQPDAECYEIVLSTWAQSGHVDAPRKTEQLIMMMDRRYQANPSSAKPTTVHFNHVMAAWTKSMDHPHHLNHATATKHSSSSTSNMNTSLPHNLHAAHRAQDILHHMTIFSRREADLNVMPNLATYATVISAWAKSKTEDCGKRADAILRMVEKQNLASIRNYNMEDHDVHHGHDRFHFFPDTIMFNQVIDAYAKESSNNSYSRARDVLLRQMNLYKKYRNPKCKPDVYSFTGVLSACASFNGPRKDRLLAFQLCQETYADMLRANVSPNHVTYGTLMKACARLLPEGKEKRQYTREYFRKAQSDGCVGEMVMNRLSEAASDAQYHGLLKGFNKSNLPEEWTYNVPEHEKKNMKKSACLLP